MKTLCIRLRRGDDLLAGIRSVAARENLTAAVVLSAVGCVSRACVRDAGGVKFREIPEPCEIVSLNGTVSRSRCHLHIALSKEDLSTVGGHLAEGCIVNTTAEIVLLELEDVAFGAAYDADTGYDEITIQPL